LKELFKIVKKIRSEIIEKLNQSFIVLKAKCSANQDTENDYRENIKKLMLDKNNFKFQSTEFNELGKLRLNNISNERDFAELYLTIQYIKK